MSHDDRNALLARAAQHGQAYLGTVADRPVAASATSEELRSALGSVLGAEGTEGAAVIDALAAAAERGTLASQGPRYFGFVIGGSLPVATAADWLVSAWDQNSAVYAMAPMVSVVEEITAGWMRDLLRLPDHRGVGFVTGCQMASFTALAAARHDVLRRAGWDVERRIPLHHLHGPAPAGAGRRAGAASPHRRPGPYGRSGTGPDAP